MSDIWPLDAKRKQSRGSIDEIRPFKCLLLMPFESRFNTIAEIIKKTVEQTVEIFQADFHFMPSDIQRLDWVTSSGIIQGEIWKEIDEADLIFCDITGYNPNVMFEFGVCSSWKEMSQVVIIKDHFFRQEFAFDISPIRYTEYELTTDGIPDFSKKIKEHTFNALKGYPDFQGSRPELTFPLRIDFNDNRDDERIYTPPYAHRRVINQALEFGSRVHFASSWASIGKTKFENFQLEFTAKFGNPIQDSGYIGVGLRSQHYFANFAYILYLDYEGRIIIALPDEDTDKHYTDHILRDKTPIDLNKFFDFRVKLDSEILEIQIDMFKHAFQVSEMKKVFGPGLIRFQAYKSWIVLKKVALELLP